MTLLASAMRPDISRTIHELNVYSGKQSTISEQTFIQLGAKGGGEKYQEGLNCKCSSSNESQGMRELEISEFCRHGVGINLRVLESIVR
jgi:hypothetical protein